MHIIPLEQTSKRFHDPEIYPFAAVFSAELQTHIAQENFLYDSQDCYIKAGNDFWKYESQTRFVPAMISKTKYKDLCESTKAIFDAELVKIDDRLWIPICRIGGDNWEEIGAEICTRTDPPQLFPVMEGGNYWLFDTGTQRVYVYRRRFFKQNNIEVGE